MGHGRGLAATLMAGAAAIVGSAGLRAQEASAPSAGPGETLDEIVVTAQRRSENLREVPISISVIDGADLEKQHVQGFDAVTRMTPGVSFSTGAGEGAGEGQETVEIRGVSSNVGAATVGIYMDEMPITLPGEVGSTQPKFFDMERIEVLRGPQGTLYGSSSEGGTLRYITRQADPREFAAETSLDTSVTEHGGANFDVRGVVNVPLVDNRFALRFGVQFGEQSGWIDRYGHAPGYLNLTTSDGQKLGSGVNDQNDIALKLAAKYLGSDELTITPLFYFQHLHEGDQPAFFLGQSLYTQENSVPQPIQDSFFVSSLNVQKGFAFGDLTSNTGWYWKDIDRQADGTYYDPAYVVPYILDPALPAFQPRADLELSALPTTAYDHQTVIDFVQEIRLASKPAGANESPLKWVTGLFFDRESYRLQHHESAPGWNELFKSVYGFSPDSPASPVSASGFPDLWALDQFQHNLTERQKNEYAAFGQLDYDFTRSLHGGIGARYDWTRLPYERYAGGFFNVGNPTAYTAVTHENAFTPKFSLKYDTSETSNVYASAAKGFRVGGVNNPVPYAICAGDYATLGISPEPQSYVHDSLWTEELGSKAELFNRSFAVSGAVYQTKWNNIQQQIELPTCGYAYVSNVGDATIHGGELELRYKVSQLRGLTLGANGSIQQAKITAAFPGSPASVGQHVLYTPEWNAAAMIDYNWTVSSHTSAFMHADVQWTGSSNGSFQVGNPDYNDPSYSVVNATGGLDISSWNVALYATNLLDNHTIIKHPEVNLVIEAYTVQPRTIGIRVSRQLP